MDPRRAALIEAIIELRIRRYYRLMLVAVNPPRISKFQQFTQISESVRRARKYLWTRSMPQLRLLHEQAKAGARTAYFAIAVVLR